MKFKFAELFWSANRAGLSSKAAYDAPDVSGALIGQG